MLRFLETCRAGPEVDCKREANEFASMNDGTAEHVVDSEWSANPCEVSAAPTNDRPTLPESQPTIHYASDAEVDTAMEKIFQKHDKLFKELAK